MLNSICLTGRLVQAPDLRKTSSGASVTSFTLACDRDFGAKETDFIPVVAWRRTAEFVASYFAKGHLMTVHGRLETRNWQDKDGENHKTFEVVADSVYFGEAKRVETPAKAPASSTTFDDFTDEDGELPF